MTDNINKIENLEEIKQLISQAEAVLITAGAGMGVDSGLPDFRGNEGFWKAYPIAEKLNLSFTQLASPSWFYEDPFFAWAFFGQFQKALFDENKIVECHGRISHF